MFTLDGYQALRQEAAIVRRTDLGVLSVTGADRLQWLQGLLTNDVLALPIGGHCEAAYLTPQGRMVTDVRVVNLPTEALLEVPASLSASLATRLDALIFSEDVQVADASQRLLLVDVHGPRSGTVVGSLTSAPGLVHAQIADSVYGVPGVTLFVPAASVESVESRLNEAGARTSSLDTLNVLRVESGRPQFLVDMDEHTIPLEAGLEARAISFTKGCYVGQEVIVRVTHRGGGRVARKLVGVELEVGATAERDARMLAGGREIGRLTSVVSSPAVGRDIALGYVHRDYVDPGTRVQIVTPRGEVGAVVSSLPFA
jgi:folate-binding protein YgfZ